MPIQLNNAFSVGSHGDHDLTHVQVSSVSINIKNRRLSFEVMYGYYEDGGWVWSEYQPDVVRTFSIKDKPAFSGEDGKVKIPEKKTYTNFLIAMVPNSTDEKICNGITRVLQQWLLDNGHFEGTIV